jgi:hypothetical protein
MLRRTRTIPSLLVTVALLNSGAFLFAQKVDTKDAGGGRKIELHYNAEGQVVETRSIGADGKLQQIDALEYLPGAYIPNSVTTVYFPNGNTVQKIVRNTYDNNSNFTGEFIQIFNEAGKQIGGHRLTHDAKANIYVCQDWKVDAYKTVECPAGEESNGTPETVKKFTAEEVRKQLERARAAKPTSAAGKASTGAVSEAPSIAPEKGPAPKGKYLAAPICFIGQACVVRGAFGGDASKTFAAFEDRPAKILAETKDTLYLAIPEGTGPGPRSLVIGDGSKMIAFPMVVAEFVIRPDRRDLPKGEILLMYPAIEGPAELPDPEWRAGNFPPSNLERARKLVPGFEPAGAKGAGKEEREETEKREREGHDAKGKQEEKEGGEILLVIKNLTPDLANFRESKDGVYVLPLTAESFSRGDYGYKFVVEAKETGNFAFESYVIPFLAPIAGQEFPLTSGAGGH